MITYTWIESSALWYKFKSQLPLIIEVFHSYLWKDLYPMFEIVFPPQRCSTLSRFNSWTINYSKRPVDCLKRNLVITTLCQMRQSTELCASFKPNRITCRKSNWRPSAITPEKIEWVMAAVSANCYVTVHHLASHVNLSWATKYCMLCSLNLKLNRISIQQELQPANYNKPWLNILAMQMPHISIPFILVKRCRFNSMVMSTLKIIAFGVQKTSWICGKWSTSRKNRHLVWNFEKKNFWIAIVSNNN